MPRIRYRAHQFHDAKLTMIARVNQLVLDYQRQGFDLTLRQVYYQCVSRAWLPNTDAAYAWLGTLISEGRLAGLIDWYAIVDRTRNLIEGAHWADPGAVVASAARSYALDKWARQPYYLEVWVEKDALAGVVGHACRPLDVPYIACRGYMSQSEMWQAGRRLQVQQVEGKQVVIIHLGDHDPSGVDMTRDIAERLALFCEAEVEVQRIALTMDQIEELRPPPNPAKVSDSRAGVYIARYGTSSWELDALEPTLLAGLIERTVLAYRDESLWEDDEDAETAARAVLVKVAEHWDDVARYANGRSW